MHFFFLIKHSFLIRWRIALLSNRDLSLLILINSLCGNQNDKKKKKSTFTANNMTHAIDGALSFEFVAFYIEYSQIIIKKATIRRNGTWDQLPPHMDYWKRWKYRNIESLMCVQWYVCEMKSVCNSIVVRLSYCRYYAR